MSRTSKSLNVSLSRKSVVCLLSPFRASILIANRKCAKELAGQRHLTESTPKLSAAAQFSHTQAQLLGEPLSIIFHHRKNQFLLFEYDAALK